MRRIILWMAALLMAASALQVRIVNAQTKEEVTVSKTESPKAEQFKPEQQASKGSVTVKGTLINYDAFAGTLVVHPKDWDDVPQNRDKDDKSQPVEASMFYVAYFKSDNRGPQRPVTFLFNGGPGSSTVWLHMGAFGPKRVVTLDDSHTPAAPYPVINNDYSLLDVSDLVFVDAPGTGFSRIAGKDREKAFYGVDQDAQAFADFITQFLGKYGRWNAPKYMFGESYGTTRSAVLSRVLETERDVDFNGIILLSQILNFNFSADGPEFNPGVELPYQLALPTYAASAWYHHKLPDAPKELAPLLAEVEHFADDGLCAGAGGGIVASSGTAQGNRGETASIHRPAGGVHPEGGAADQRRRIFEDAARRRQHDDGTAGHALFGADAGSAEQGSGIRSAIGGNKFGVCVGV